MLAHAERSYPFATPRPGWSEQDPDVWWTAAESVLDELGAVACDGILWNDGRAQRQCEEIEARVGRDRLIELSGNRALAGFTAPKLLWLAEHEPDVHARIHRVMLPKDYVRLRLCGEHATDVTDASGTWLFDVAARTWSTELAAALDVDPAWLPPALESGAISGLTRRGSVPVAAGAGDQAGGALGVGVIDQDGPASVGVRHHPRRQPSFLLPRSALGVARNGSDAFRGRLAELAARCARR